jgi:hypothetical protein
MSELIPEVADELLGPVIDDAIGGGLGYWAGLDALTQLVLDELARRAAKSAAEGFHQGLKAGSRPGSHSNPKTDVLNHIERHLKKTFPGGSVSRSGSGFKVQVRR